MIPFSILTEIVSYRLIVTAKLWTFFHSIIKIYEGQTRMSIEIRNLAINLYKDVEMTRAHTHTQVDPF